MNNDIHQQIKLAFPTGRAGAVSSWRCRNIDPTSSNVMAYVSLPWVMQNSQAISIHDGSRLDVDMPFSNYDFKHFIGNDFEQLAKQNAFFS